MNATKKRIAIGTEKENWIKTLRKQTFPTELVFVHTSYVIVHSLGSRELVLGRIDMPSSQAFI